MRLALNQREAAAALGMSVNTFKEQVRPFIRSFAVGSAARYPVKDLESWVDSRAQKP